MPLIRVLDTTWESCSFGLAGIGLFPSIFESRCENLALGWTHLRLVLYKVTVNSVSLNRIFSCTDFSHHAHNRIFYNAPLYRSATQQTTGMSHLTQLWESGWSDVRAPNHLASYYIELGRKEEAEVWYRRALQVCDVTFPNRLK